MMEEVLWVFEDVQGSLWGSQAFSRVVLAPEGVLGNLLDVSGFLQEVS